jgi:hypothetical protein
MAKRSYKLNKSYGLQTETRQYLRRLYSYGRELNPSDVADIDNFIKGLKQFNLLQNIIVYPFRSQYNLGSGANILSFGGIGKFDGLMINGPTWGLSGINFTAASSQYIRIPNFLNNPVISGFSMICLHQPDFTTIGRALLGNDGATSTTRGIRINVQNHSYLTGTGVAERYYFTFNSSPTSSTGDAVAGTLLTYNTAQMHVNYISFAQDITAGLATSLNSSTTTSSKALPFFNNTAFNTMGIGARNGSTGTGDYFQGTMALMMIANRSITPAEYINVYNLIKTTIGKGLGLP